MPTSTDEAEPEITARNSREIYAAMSGPAGRPDVVREALRHAVTDGVTWVFLAAAISSAVMFVAALFLREITVRRGH